MPAALISRRSLLCCASAAWLMHAGCTASLFNSPEPIVEDIVDSDEPAKTIVIGDLTGTWGMKPFKVESIALVTGLDNTGSDPGPSPQRDILIGDMQAHQVASPNGVLASPRTSMVLVRALLPPGVRKGDRVDLELIAPPRSETSSLKGGWLMPTRLKELAVLQGQLRSGHEYALGQGHVLVDAELAGGNEAVSLKRGKILGGGVALKSRPLGLALRNEHQSVRNSSLIGAAINSRFSMFDEANIKTGVATPLRDNYIELEVHPRYRHNLWRYVRVVSEIPIRETPQQKIDRVDSLGRQLLEPATSARAALKLESLGKESANLLGKGMNSDNDEVRFYAAEAMAYLDQAEAVPVLADLARREPAFRWHALTALSSMDELDALDALAELMHVDSNETRYGAFRAMKARNSRDVLIKGEKLSDQLMLHVVNSDGAPLVHISRSREAEIVLFGRDIRLSHPLVLLTDSRVTIKSLDNGQMQVSRYAPGEDDRQVVCSSKLDDVIRQMVAVGATYPDIVNIVQQAKKQGNLTARVEVDALPRPGRTYQRDAGETSGRPNLEVASPLPGLFSYTDPEDEEEVIATSDNPAETPATEAEPEQRRGGILGRLRG